MSTQGYVAYVGPFPFPWGQAGSRRVYGIARALVAGGHKVVVANGETTPRAAETLERDGIGELLHVGVGDGTQVGQSLLGKAFHHLVAHGHRTVRWLEAQPIPPSHVVVYGGYAPFMARLLPWCRKRDVALIADVVEWYDPRQLNGGFWGPFNASTKFALRFQFSRCSGVIAISSYLERHFRERGVPTLRVPPTLDVRAMVPPPADGGRDAGRTVLIYAGTPGRKDLLANVIRGVWEVDPDATRVRLDVLGPSAREVEQLLRQSLPRSVRILGRLPQAEVGGAYANADFSVLLREPLRFANAGFPTKVPESLATGTPVICNVTSDIGEHVRDGKEGLICSDHTVASFARALDRALALTSSQRTAMRHEARRTAERSFDWRNYSRPLTAFLDEVKSK